ncbi:MAG: hypothetical protein JHC37_02030 [Campylobacteraceae bacterium]|nr:hypothetical protein [Campylobacteraceae bacterium]
MTVFSTDSITSFLLSLLSQDGEPQPTNNKAKHKKTILYIVHSELFLLF